MSLANQYAILLALPPQVIRNAPVTQLMPPDEMRGLFAHCCAEFNKSQQIETARLSAQAFRLNCYRLTSQVKQFMDNGADIERFAKQIQDQRRSNRFNMDLLVQFESLIPEADFQRLLAIASNGLAIPVPDDFQPVPPNPTQRTTLGIFYRTRTASRCETAAGILPTPGISCN